MTTPKKHQKTSRDTKGLSSLRKQAEKELNQQEEKIDSLSHLGVNRLAHELATHQFELEIQNDELRKAEAELETSRRRLAELYDFAPVGYFSLDTKGIILEANVTGADMLGTSKRKLIRKAFRVFIEDGKDRQKFLDYCGEVIKNQVRTVCELRLRGKDRRSFYARLESVLFEDSGAKELSIRTVVSDITDRRKAEDIVERLLERYRSYIEVTGQLGWTCSADGEVIEDSPSWRAYTGQTYDEVKGWGWTRALHPDDIEHSKRLWRKAVAEKRPYEAEYRMRRHDGVYRYFMARGIPVLRGDGSVREWVGTCIDITERQQVEREREDALAELRRSNSDLEQFANAISHDLQAPLRSISAFIQILADDYRGRLDAEGDDYINRVVAGAGRMKRMIDDLLAYSKIGARNMEFGTVDTEAVITQAIANLHAMIGERSAVITHDPLPTIKADQSPMVMLFQNLIGNAIKFTTHPPRIHISAISRGDEWVFGFCDNGIGVPQKYWEGIFNLFQRLHTDKEYSGTGTGLAICKKIVERHGGRIWVESNEGGGSTFFFTIPGGN